jgi:autotransporter-associated beta strand protein
LTATQLQFASSDFIASISYSNVQQFGLDLGGGADSLIISGATLRTPGANTISAGTGVTIQSGGTLDLGGYADTVDYVVLRNGTIADGTLLASSFSVQSGTVSADLAGSAGLQKSTDGTVTLSGNNSYTGGTLVSAGTLQVLGSSPDALPATGTVKVEGGVLDLGGGSEAVPQIVVTAGSVQDGTISNGSQEIQNGTFSADIGGGGSLLKTGSGTAIVSGANTYTGGTTVSEGLLVVENIAAIPSGSLLSIGPGGSVVLGDPGAPELLAVAQTPGAGPLEPAVAAAGQAAAEAAPLVVSAPTVTPAGGGPASPAASDSVLAASAMGVPTAVVVPAAVDRLLATQPVPESNVVASAIVTWASLSRPSAPRLMPSGWFSIPLSGSPVPHSDVTAADHTGGQPAGNATPRVAAPRTAASDQASDEALLRIVDTQTGNAAARAGNQHPAMRLFGLDLPTLDLLAGAAAKR